MADDKDSATEEAKKFATSSKTKKIPFVVPNEFENGPDNYGVNAKDLNTESILSDLGKILN